MAYVLRALITGQEIEKQIKNGTSNISVVKTEIRHWQDNFPPNSGIKYSEYPRVKLASHGRVDMTVEEALVKLRKTILEAYPEWEGELSTYTIVE